MEISDETIAAMRAAAEAATPGPWTWSTEGLAAHARRLILCATNGELAQRAACGGALFRFDADSDNAKHIAACDPQAVLALIARLDRAEEGLRVFVNHGSQLVAQMAREALEASDGSE